MWRCVAGYLVPDVSRQPNVPNLNGLNNLFLKELHHFRSRAATRPWASANRHFKYKVRNINVPIASQVVSRH